MSLWENEALRTAGHVTIAPLLFSLCCLVHACIRQGTDIITFVLCTADYQGEMFRGCRQRVRMTPQRIRLQEIKIEIDISLVDVIQCSKNTEVEMVIDCKLTSPANSIMSTQPCRSKESGYLQMLLYYAGLVL